MRLEKLVLIVLAAVVLAGSPLKSQEVGQFLTSEATTSSGQILNLLNPDEFEYLAIAIGYDSDGSLATQGDHGGGCRAVRLPPHGNDGDEMDDPLLDESPNFQPDHYEIIAIPIEGKHAGVWDTSETLGLGIHTTIYKGAHGSRVPLQAFAPPEDEGDRDQLVGCICCELAELGLPRQTLQTAFGLVCPLVSPIACEGGEI